MISYRFLHSRTAPASPVPRQNTIFGEQDRLHKAVDPFKIVRERKHISVHLVCSETVFETQFRWLRWATVGVFIAISSVSAWAAPNAEHQGQAEPHRHIAKPHKTPAPHAKVAPKKKRPTVSHKPAAKRFSNHSSASPHKVAAQKKRVHTPTTRPASTSHPLAATKAHKFEPVRDFRDSNREEVEKPRIAKAPESGSPTKTLTSPAAVSPPPPKEPDVPTVQAPKAPDVEATTEAAKTQ